MKLYKVTCYKLWKTYPILFTRYCKKKKKRYIALSMIKQEKKGIYMQMAEVDLYPSRYNLLYHLTKPHGINLQIKLKLQKSK